jgi:hypothetical protein
MDHARSLQSMPAADNLKRAVAWTAAAAIIGYSIPAIFSSGLHWPRSLFLVPYVAAVAVLFAVFFRSNGFSLREFTRYWAFGIAGAAVVGYYVVQNIYSQPGSAVPQGAELAWALFWFGIAYGVADALFLNVLPVLIFQGPNLDETNPAWRRRIMCGLFGILASLVITGAYHLGFAEYRNISLIFPLIGNTIITAGYVLTRSPLTALGAHAAMHVAGVLHGMETVMQLPPHY